MNRKLIIAVSVLSAIMCGCAREAADDTGTLTKQVFDQWIEDQKAEHPEYLWRKTNLGVYILEEEEGTGGIVGDCKKSPYICVSYTIADKSGKITDTNVEESAKLINTYNPSYYYGPDVTWRGSDELFAGLEEFIPSMKVGGRVKAIIPAWLFSSARYKSEETYIRKVKNNTTCFYDVTITDAFEDEQKWELDSLERFVQRNFGKQDTLKTGCWYIRTKAPSDETELKSGTAYYINYTGSLLSGQVFDTTVMEDAIDARIYNEKNNYAPVYVTWNSDYSAITMGSDEGSLVDGFAYCISKMKKGEKGIAIFWSGLGYGSTRKGANLPAYSPLMFKLEMIGEEAQ